MSDYDKAKDICTKYASLKPWQQFVIEEEIFLIKLCFVGEQCHFLISDFTNMHHEHADKDSLLKRVQVLFLINFLKIKLVNFKVLFWQPSELWLMNFSEFSVL